MWTSKKEGRQRGGKEFMGVVYDLFLLTNLHLITRNRETQLFTFAEFD